MLTFEIVLFFLSIILLSTSIAGYGSLIKLKNNDNLFTNIFLGFAVISLIITVIHFFFSINLLISFLMFFFGIFIFFLKKRKNFTNIIERKNVYFLLIILLLIPIYVSQKYHEDFGYYHLPYAIGLIEEKIIFGFSNIDQSYVYNSIWLNLYSIFFLNDKNFNFLTLPSFLLYLTFIIFTLNQVISKKKIIVSDYYLIVTLFYFILKFTRISEFGVDLPSIIFSVLGIYYFFKFFETEILEEKEDYFFLIVIFSIFSILIKLSTIPIILLSFYLYIKFFKNLKYSIFRLRYFLVYFLSLSFLIQQYIYTGCFLFPSNFTCLNVSWFNEDYLKLSRNLELVNKSYYHEAKDIYNQEEFLSNLNWIYFWFKRSFIEIMEHLLTIILPSLFFLLFLKKNDESRLYFKENISLYTFLFVSLLFWLNFSPVYRFAIHLFVTLIFMMLLNFFSTKKFSKKIFFIFFSIFLLFSFSKNILRISKSDDIYLGIQKINNEYIYNSNYTNKYVKIFRPNLEKNRKNSWQGRLCWDIPFVCSYNNLEVVKKNGYLIFRKLKN